MVSEEMFGSRWTSLFIYLIPSFVLAIDTYSIDSHIAAHTDRVRTAKYNSFPRRQSTFQRPMTSPNVTSNIRQKAHKVHHM
ncbi:uncharacterized protein EV420DRAFT_1552861 [Desarmillaria tabescens]|uniref:Uncharacterized protein n=1 Tax=Armillaria tabescens TaxID=1929756 RepID=A0AA39N372_ARMTA|nr:uncharacterized protein EV420DRAFT_1552861 [Desarmillaria tabescens]KAK0455719.1 hypothetical protein EV420DRAFT_1552861 [Desarmillaria tabescens]